MGFDEILCRDGSRTIHSDSVGYPVQDLDLVFLNPTPDTGIFGLVIVESGSGIVYQLRQMILLLCEALCDLLSEWTSLNSWFINVIFRFPVS